MNNKFVKMGGMGALLLAFSALSFGHGFVDSPGARNYFCGAVTKPDHVMNGVARYPECAGAFANDFNGGYSYMSVLTHHQGRKVLGPVARNVCGFDSETWNGGKTPWDNAINWPVNNINSGTLTFSWDISNGPHFDDTSDFRYWITKPGFVYQVGRELTWADFEDQPFCDLAYNDDNPGAYPNVRADKPNTHFHTTCTVPARTGRHVIYAEWGREPPTYERFHGCIDVQIGGGSNSSVPVSSSSSSRSSSSSSLAPSSSSRSSSSSSSVSSSRSSSSSVVSSSSSSRPASSSSSSTGGSTEYCNWYGWQVAICKNTTSGWSNENQQTCIGRDTCNAPR
ncbi:lytic polysaccharide monooxygenase [Cellvibrio japonicus]|uniref:Chitin binding protein, putative, cbp33/10B n=1 Tax=Cellvibrio japonicus (strain Ueda107) TaxID=498211 RepID=B3PDT6_CELJU|nr:lytic polysaccharide monooxygenase [Cellvibrio japonicus]ACE84760.1 chitin binding protein, putative, cbp33/10B [Cellvibrio japonicus Ueda107]QEI13423.1 chitin-binding protein [Cellvibrio japonicus]QEI16997.1 chitin-binding protein [Cellvibrio japonicus]QEI20575.1 chitin-binding protein [Cellvibrio japonicus]